jgi:N6-L-threonylcarbamoyladenine synthase
MRVLGIESSCDESAVSIVDAQFGKAGVLANIVSSQIRMHQPFGGIVPEVATREHLRNLPQILPALLAQSHLQLSDLDAIAVTQGPGLATSLLIGYSYARALALAADLPVYGVNHLEGHLFSPFLARGEDVQFPFIGLIASGGHTLLVHAKGWDNYVKLGGTIDDAAGEAFDKVARLMNLPYPGGPRIEALAKQGNPEACTFPRSFPQKNNYNFSFSGLKTSVRYFFEKNPQAHDDPAWIADLCASFQSAVVDVLARKAGNALHATGCKRLVASGGVLCNEALRVALAQTCAEHGATLHVADAKLCTDNAAMIASTAAQKLDAGLTLTIANDIDPNLSLFAPTPNGFGTRGVPNKDTLIHHRQHQRDVGSSKR